MAQPDEIFRGLGRKNLVPRLLSDAPLGQLKLGPGEGYVLSRVDGKTTLWEICLLSPLQREETLRILRRMRLSGVLEVPGSSEPMPAEETPTRQAPPTRRTPVQPVTPAKGVPANAVPAPVPPAKTPTRRTPQQAVADPAPQTSGASRRSPGTTSPRLSALLPESPRELAVETVPALSRGSAQAIDLPDEAPAFEQVRGDPGSDGDAPGSRTHREVHDVEVIINSRRSPLFSQSMIDDTRPQGRRTPNPARSPSPSSLLSPSRLSPVRPSSGRVKAFSEPVLTADSRSGASDNTDAAALRSDYHPAVRPFGPLSLPGQEDAPPRDLSPEQRQRIDEYYAMINEADAFTLLSVKQEDSKKEVQRAYFRLSKEFHPDRFFKKDLGAYRQRVAAIFQALTEAREVLSDDQRRAAYLAGEPT